MRERMLIVITPYESIKIAPFTDTVTLAENIEAYLRFVLQNVDFRSLPKRGSDGEFTAFDASLMHMSDIAHDCPRRAPLHVQVAPEVLVEPVTKGYFISGHIHEELLVSCLEYGHPGEFEYQKTLPNLPAGWCWSLRTPH
jgi:hypothetical protein